MKRAVQALLALCLFCYTSASPTIKFGGRESTIEVSGGILNMAGSPSLSDGVLRDSGGEINVTTGTFSNMVVETADGATIKAFKCDGTVTLDDDAVANNVLDLDVANGVLTVDGGTINTDINVSANSIIQGHGLFDATNAPIDVSDGITLTLRWTGIMNQTINLNASGSATTLKLENDLNFGLNTSGTAPTIGGGTADDTVNFNGYKVTFAPGASVNTTQTWQNAHVDLGGQLTVAATIDLTTAAAHIDGHGNKIVYSSGGFTQGTGTTAATITNAVLDNYNSSLLGVTGTWNLVNTTLDTGTETIRVVDGALTGGTANVFGGSSTWPSASTIELLNDWTLAGKVTFSAASTIIGNGHTINFDSTSSIIDYDGALTLSNVILTNVVDDSFDNNDAQDLRLDNVEWRDNATNGGGAIRISASNLVSTDVVGGQQYAQLSLPDGGSGTDGLLFDAASAVTWDNGASIELLSNVDLNCEWTLTDSTSINGHGHVMNLVGGQLDYDMDLYLSDIILAEVDAAALDNSATKDLWVSNMTWVDSGGNGSFCVKANPNAEASAAQLSLDASATAGDLFSVDNSGTPLTTLRFENGAIVDLLSDLTFSNDAKWQFAGDTIINGHGHVIDLGTSVDHDTFEVVDGTTSTLTITNAVIKNWGDEATNAYISFVNGNLRLSNVTIIMKTDAEYVKASTEDLHIDGPVTIVTGENGKFDASAGTADTINNVTVWYDTLGNADTSQVDFGTSGVDYTGSPAAGQVAMLPLSDSTGTQTYTSSSSYVTQSLYLSYDINQGGGDVEARGKQVAITNSSAFSLYGGGRTWYMAPTALNAVTTTRLITPSSAVNAVTIEDLTFDGWSCVHVEAGSNEDKTLKYSDGCVLRLQADETLTTTVALGYANSDAVVFDLNGHTLDMGTSDGTNGAELDFGNVTSTVTIKNGRIENLHNHPDDDFESRFRCSGTNPTIIFEDVDLVLDNHTSISSMNVKFKGSCSITGEDDYKMQFWYTPVTIMEGATLYIGNGMTLGLHGKDGSGNTSVTFSSANSTLSLDGCTVVWDTDDSSSNFTMTFDVGTIRVDNTVYLSPTSTHTFRLGGTNLDLDLMPAARLVVTDGEVEYVNAS